jgi:Ca-activated chloride channel family protein
MPHNQSAILHSAITFPNRDFVLRFSRAQSQQGFSLASYYQTSKEKGYFSLSCFPGDTLFTGERPDLEVVLLVDISGSQTGWPLQKEKEISLGILDRLLPDDRITVVSFNDQVKWCFGDKAPRAASPENISNAKNFITNLSVSGGTNLLEGVRQALSTPVTSEHKRIYIFLTDGFITNESAIFDEIKRHPTQPTIFTFGAGNNLNRYFLDQSALVGNGFSTEVMQYENVETAIENAWLKIESPQLEKVSVTIDGADIHHVIMPTGSSLFKGRPLTLYGMYSNGGSRTVTVKGYRNGVPVTLSQTVILADTSSHNTAIAKMWAKQKIELLSIDEGVSTSKKDSIVALSLEYQVLSKYTAFLAINPVAVVESESSKGNFTGINTTPADRTLVTSPIHLTVKQGQLTIQIPDGETVVMMQIFDLKGRLIYNISLRKFVSVMLIRWNGILPDGSRIKTGKYVVKLQTSKRSVVLPLLWKN